jgi:hypothetical protein
MEHNAISARLLNEKYSMAKTNTEYTSVMVNRYLLYIHIPNVEMDGIISFSVSSCWQYENIIGRLMTERMVQARVFSPNVSEKISTHNPMRNANVIT